MALLPGHLWKWPRATEKRGLVARKQMSAMIRPIGLPLGQPVCLHLLSGHKATTENGPGPRKKRGPVARKQMSAMIRPIGLPLLCLYLLHLLSGHKATTESGPGPLKN